MVHANAAILVYIVCVYNEWFMYNGAESTIFRSSWCLLIISVYSTQWKFEESTCHGVASVPTFEH